MTGKQERDAAGKLDFYISHAGPDRQWAEWVGWQLESAGYTVVLDWLPGENVVLAREDALRRAGRVLALCSRAYFRRGFTEQEWTAVLAAQQEDAPPLIPVWIEDLTEDQIPRLLRSAQPIILFGLSDAKAARRLVSSLSGEPGASGPAAFPGSGSSAEPQPDDSAKPRLPSQDHPAVWHVPPRNADFVGRDSVLVRVREELLDGSTGIVVLQGPGGMGKTQLSIEYAHRFGSDYDAVWVIDAEQPELVTSQLANLAVALSAVPAGTDAQLAATAALVALRNRKRWLLVFDNLEGPDDLAAFLPDGPGDVGDEFDVCDVIDEAVRLFGSVDILVNNAGIYPNVPLADLEPDTFDRVVAVNLRGVYLFTKFASELMKKQGRGGRIINVTSIDALHPSMIGLAAYDATKHGVWGFTKNTAAELTPFGILVNAVAPGGVMTPGTQNVTAGPAEGAEAMQAAFLAKIPMRRMGEPDEIGKVVLFLASDMASYMAGSQVVVDGGALLS